MKSSPRKSEKLYGVWKTMRQRCRDKNKEHYDRYGGAWDQSMRRMG